MTTILLHTKVDNSLYIQTISVFTAILAHIGYEEIHKQPSLIHHTCNEPSLSIAIQFIDKRPDGTALIINAELIEHSEL